MIAFEPRTDEVSLYLEPFKIVPLTPQQASAFDRPLFISGIFICYEIVFWSTTWQAWLYIVAERTERLFPPDARAREISVPEWPWYAAEAKRLGLA